MFDLPFGIPVKEEINPQSDTIMPFDHGVITTFLGRRKTPTGHRLVRSGRIIGWLAEAEKGKFLLCADEARLRLEKIESEQHRLIAKSWTLQGLGLVAELIPEAFEHAADKQGLTASGDVLERLLSRDISMILELLSQRDEVRGALAADQGMLVDSTGELPGDGDELATQIGKTLADRAAMATNLGIGEAGHWTLHTEESSLLLAEAGDLALAVWTEAAVDHSRLINAVSALLDGKIGALSANDGLLPLGFVLREGKSGTDAVLSMLADACKEEVTGHLMSGKSEKATQLALVRGVPVAIRAAPGHSLNDALDDLTEPRRVLELHRLPLGTILSAESGNVSGFTLQSFCEGLSTIRTRTESRQELIRRKLDTILGFEIGIEKLKMDRANVQFDIEVSAISSGIDAETVMAIDSGLRRSVEKAEHKVSNLEQEISALNVKLTGVEKARLAAKVSADEANNQSAELQQTVEFANSKLDTTQIDLSEAKAISEDSAARAERLSKRVNELEHQLSTRAVELARVLGDAKASAELAIQIEEMATKEATLSADIDTFSSRLTEMRDLGDNEERRLRMLNDQVEASRDRQRRAQAELIELETRINSSDLHLKSLEAESRIAVDRAEDSRSRISQDESRRDNLNSELRELMDERRNVLREIGDLGARRGQAEAKLSVLIDQAEALADAHEDALEDINEAEKIRARLSEEPLAQALLDDEGTFEALGPILDRLEHARTLGYSVSLLDRAVERSLQVIQQTVDHVAKTPRHLLSNEVMDLLERQVPTTAGAVRGLARWSVQQKLEHQLGDTVNHLILDLENLLEDHDRAITMLRRIRGVLEQLEGLGAPSEQIEALKANCRRPESLPHLAKETRKLIRIALDDIHLESDLRDAGSAVKLEATTLALEELITQLDATGLTEGVPKGALWDFQRDGHLPFEIGSVPAGKRLAVSEDSLEEMDGELIDQEAAIQIEDEDIPVEWVALEAPVDVDEPKIEFTATPTPLRNSDHDERAALEEELARLDARWQNRLEPEERGTSNVALSSLEADLVDIDL